jgi:hypothetical protein
VTNRDRKRTAVVTRRDALAMLGLSAVGLLTRGRNPENASSDATLSAAPDAIDRSSPRVEHEKLETDVPNWVFCCRH